MNKPKYFLYARKSTEDDDKQVMSIPAQLVELREFASRENLEILEEFQESKSAKSPGREVFGVMMMRIEKMDGVGILAWHPDRLARNSIDGGRIIYAVDTSKIVALRFPTFWFEPTPQGLFMLQVAFGQSKYYSDNLSENIKRGVRQKLRRGEWLAKAPFGYVNNPVTRNIEPDAVKSKIIVRAYEEYAKGTYTLVSMAQFLADHNVTTKAGTPIGKASVKRILTNRAYLGFTKHHDEFFPGSFAPILSPRQFEAVQKILAGRGHKRKVRGKHDFPFANLFRCAECGGMFTAQWCTGKMGGRYRYYRCTKKKGNCGAKYLREDLLATQIKERLQTISLPDKYTGWMLNKVSEWEREETAASGSEIQNLSSGIKAAEERVEKLVGVYLDGDIPKNIYLVKKDALMRSSLALQEKKKDFERGRKNWVEPLRQWVLDTKQALVLGSSDDLHEISNFVRKVGTNPVIQSKSMQFRASPPSENTARKRAEMNANPLIAGSRSELNPAEVSFCDPTENRTLI
ncbi:MAG: recombinase family protein [Candidatus Yonathbacteria bacterium]|nr:recombinase family protein [Candidatus Yonathbacteria bacterium]